MRNRVRVVWVAVLCLVLATPQSWGWNSIGHMSVAYVAYQQLTPQQKARVAVLLALNPDYKKWLSYIPKNSDPAKQGLYVFMMAATWPDEIKAMGSGYKMDADVPPHSAEATNNTGYTDAYMHKYWHFVNVEISTDGSPVSSAVTAPNAQTQIAAFRKVLASDAPDALKSYDLVWLLHLVGDIHQPLHCAERISAGSKTGDGGGNSVKIDVLPNDLHGYWDNLLGVGDTKDFPVAVAAAGKLPAADATAAKDSNEADWAKESTALAKSSVYVNPPIGDGLGPFKMATSKTYAADSLKVAEARVALAGTRLANLLNTELK